MKNGYIYRVKSLTDKIYIGQTVDVERHKSDYSSALKPN